MAECGRRILFVDADAVDSAVPGLFPGDPEISSDPTREFVVRGYAIGNWPEQEVARIFDALKASDLPCMLTEVPA